MIEYLLIVAGAAVMAAIGWALKSVRVQKLVGPRILEAVTWAFGQGLSAGAQSLASYALDEKMIASIAGRSGVTVHDTAAVLREFAEFVAESSFESPLADSLVVPEKPPAPRPPRPEFEDGR